MHLFINALAASAGAGLTYVRNVVPQFAAGIDVQATILVRPSLRQEFGSPDNISFVEREIPPSVAGRFWYEQVLLPGLIRASGAEVLISTGNVGLRNSPVPQILLSGNSLYTSADFFSDLKARKAYSLWLDTRIKAFFAKRSIYWADCTVAPTEAYAQELRRWTGRNVVSIYHGFDPGVFFRNTVSLSGALDQKLQRKDNALRLLFVSHYNYYRNFETLFRAIPLVQRRLGNREVKLFLTCKLRSEDNPGSYNAESALALVNCLGIADQVVELGAVPYSQLHHVYAACDVYVTAAYAETFAHPLVEAMASRLPIVASDLPVHREVCRHAAVYFRTFSPEEVAEQILRVVSSNELLLSLVNYGRTRSLEFSWRQHVEQIVELCRIFAISGGDG